MNRWEAAAIVALIAVVVGCIWLLEWDRRQQWPQGECFDRGYTDVRYTREAIYCIKVDGGRSVVLKLGRYRD